MIKMEYIPPSEIYVDPEMDHHLDARSLWLRDVVDETAFRMMTGAIT